jgi:HK97 family phage portal protein
MSDNDLPIQLADGSQLELFDKGISEEMSMVDFAKWASEMTGSSVTGAMQIAAFMLCCDVIAQDISKATLRLRQGLENNTSKVVAPTRHAIAEMLALEPNQRMTWKMAIEMMTYWSCFTDNAYAGVIRATDGSVLEIIPFQSYRVTERVYGREVFYDVTAGTQQEMALLGSSFRTFPERDMIHVRTRLIDGMEGYSTLDAGRKTIEIMTNLSEYRMHLFGEEGQMRGVFTRENTEPLPDLMFQRVRQQFKILMNKFRQLTEPIILEGGVKFEKISSNPKEMELAQQFEAQINEVCRMFRMPPHKVFLMTGSKYENLETQEKMYVGDTLLPRAIAIEQQFAKILLVRKERLKFFLQFDRAEMTLRDTKVETDRAIRALERGAIMIDEARAVFGYNPLPNGAGRARLIPTNMTLVDEHNQVIVAGSSTAEPTTEEAPPAEESTNSEDEPADDEKKAVGLRLIRNN